jgi:IMP dehydrogenase
MDHSYKALDAFLKTMQAAHLRLTYPEVRLESLLSNVVPSSVSLRSLFSEHVFSGPVIGAAMDMVTETNMAIALAEYGGLGVIHRAQTPKEQADMVARVKHSQNGRLADPITITSDMTVAQLLQLRREKRYKFHRFPVLDGAGVFAGLVTRKDLQFCDDPSTPVSAIMTPRGNLVVAKADTDKREAYKLMRENKRESLPLLAADGTFVGLFLFADLHRIFAGESSANVDGNDQLRVAAAIGTGPEELERAVLLLEEKCDVLVVDTAHGYTENMRQMIEAIRGNFSSAEIVAGNVSNPEAALGLARWGVNGVKVGQGPGSICITRTVAGIGAPQASAVGNCARALRDNGFGHIPVCADGGIVDAGDIVVALGLGASTVMLGNLLAGTDESPGEIILDAKGLRSKKYRGMGSISAMRDNRSARERYRQDDVLPNKLVAEGVEAMVSYKGPVALVLDQLTGGLRQGMGYLGVSTISDLPKRARPFRVTSGGQYESGAHHVVPSDGN